MDQNPVYGLETRPDAACGGVVTLGNFDGVHRGHQRIVQTARQVARAAGLPAVAVTFEPPPERILHPEHDPQRLVPANVKLRRLREAGADHVLTVRTDRVLLEMSPKEFVEQVLVADLRPRHVVEGQNFYFGLARSGNVQTLRRAGDVHAFDVHTVEPLCVELPDGTQRVSSTLIRRLITAGRVEDAATCLGRPFALFGRVVAGSGRGRLLEFPTANLDCGDQAWPGDGVYAGRARAGERWFPAAVSVGAKPTLGPAPRTIEAHLIDADGDYYEREMEVELIRRLRPQQRFENEQRLRAQIAEDVDRVRQLRG